ncbi:hypothetical protein DY245_30830 [Streptomyces inhibens]|uniref:Uncharacterized protein n=1 Tax=Streptomyces inhibens TaxID=2293571 RepID=A0A371PWB9_STRIH|nr:hypothetical protein DY245_30830 [Streptomyces inhibens]
MIHIYPALPGRWQGVLRQLPRGPATAARLRLHWPSPPDGLPGGRVETTRVKAKTWPLQGCRSTAARKAAGGVGELGAPLCRMRATMFPVDGLINCAIVRPRSGLIAKALLARKSRCHPLVFVLTPDR